ncbi:sulfite exporter TauE/SafE family protein [Vibrio sp. WJH972]
MIDELFAAALIGVVSSAHCFGMCGGISALLGSTCSNKQQLPFVIALYNIGRLTSYTLMGALLGSIAYSLIELSQLNQMLGWMRILSGIILIMLGLYLARAWFGIQKIESLGQHIWKFISPVARQLIPLKKPWYALPLGFLWGWLPCGLVYSMLTWSLASGNGVSGGLIMLFFGFGTLPSMVLMASSTTIMSKISASPIFRVSSGFMIVLYGGYILYTSLSLL